MEFVKKLIILSGAGGAKGSAAVERNAFGAQCTLSLYNLPDLSRGEYVFMISSEGGEAELRRLGRLGKVNTRFEIADGDFSKIHAAVASADGGRADVKLYGTNAKNRLWAGNLTDIIRGKLNEDSKEANIASRPKESGAQPTQDSGVKKQNLEEYFFDIFPPAGGYADNAVAKVNYYSGLEYTPATELGGRLTGLSGPIEDEKKLREERARQRAELEEKVRFVPIDGCENSESKVSEAKETLPLFSQREASYILEMAARLKESVREELPYSDVEPPFTQSGLMTNKDCKNPPQAGDDCAEALSCDECSPSQNAAERDSVCRKSVFSAEESGELKSDSEKTKRFAKGFCQSVNRGENRDSEANLPRSEDKIGSLKNAGSLKGRCCSTEEDLEQEEISVEVEGDLIGAKNPGSSKQAIKKQVDMAVLRHTAAAKEAAAVVLSEAAPRIRRGEDTLLNQPEQKRPEKLTFYEQLKGQIDGLFAGNKAETALETLMPDTKWVRVDYDTSGKYFVVGLIGRRPDFICYGVPAKYTPEPPEELDGYCQWMPANPDTPQGEGYWLMFQDAVTGESLESV